MRFARFCGGAEIKMKPVTIKAFEKLCENALNCNVFVEFKRDFLYKSAEMRGETKSASLKVYSDFRYAAFINRKFVLNAQFSDPKKIKTYAERDVSQFLKDGENEIYIVIFHMAYDHQVIRATEKPFVAFEINCGGETILSSNEQTLCRLAKNYSVGAPITFQIGEGFNYDFCAEPDDWQKSELLTPTFVEKKRSILINEITAPVDCAIAAQGEFAYSEKSGIPDGFDKEPGKRFQECFMLAERFKDMVGRDRSSGDVLKDDLNAVKFSAVKRENSPIKPNGTFVIADLGRETCGYLTFSVSVKKSCKAAVCWGEHLSDLRVRSWIDGRNFAFEFNLKQGENVFDDYILRLGLRYLCLFVEADFIEVKRLTVRETYYPFKHVKKDFGDGLLNAVYRTGRRTLELCAHEHYEDCPWREQALYGLDSRNQMLFGYGAFNEYEFPRASLKLFADSLRADGLVEICPPSRGKITIPSFTLYWIIAVCENAEADYNEEFLTEILPAVETAMGKFIERADDIGVKLFVEPEFWNFHEWSDGLEGGEIWRTKEIPVRYDGILTALCAVAAKKLAETFKTRGESEKARKYADAADKFRELIENFYSEQKGFYASYLNESGKEKSGWHEYTQAVVLCAGAAEKSRVKKLIAALKNANDELIKMTYSAMLMKYQAIASADGNYNWCVNNVAQVFGKAVLSGATSFYETENGEKDFGDAGSLCHGWSSVACYVLDKSKNEKNK